MNNWYDCPEPRLDPPDDYRDWAREQELADEAADIEYEWRRDERILDEREG